MLATDLNRITSHWNNDCTWETTPRHDVHVADGPADSARQVVRLLREPNLREHLARNARRLVEERYDWWQIGRRFVDLVESVVEARSLT